MDAGTMENSMEFPLKIKNRTMIFSSNSTPSYLNEDKKNKKKKKRKKKFEKKTCTPVLITSLVTIAQIQQKLWYTSIHK